MNFGDLKTRLAEILGRDPVAVIYEMVTADINQTLRLAVMESTTTLTEAASIALPSDFLAVVSVYRDVDPRTALQPTDPQVLGRFYQTSGNPSRYAIVDGNLLLDRPGGGESIELRYYARQSDLSAASDTNDVLTYYPQVYVYGALTHHALLIRDNEAIQSYAQAYQAAKMQAKGSDVSDKYSGAPAVPHVMTTP